MSHNTYKGIFPKDADEQLRNQRLIETIIAMHRHQGDAPQPDHGYHYMINPIPYEDGRLLFKVGILSPNDLAMLEVFKQPATPVPETVDQWVRSYFAKREEQPHDYSSQSLASPDLGLCSKSHP